MVVHKVTLNYGKQTLELPACAILCVQNQKEEVTMWYAVDEKSPEKKFKRIFLVIGTGSVMEEEALKYIGTAQFQGGDLVYHVFEEIHTFSNQVTAFLTQHTHKG